MRISFYLCLLLVAAAYGAPVEDLITDLPGLNFVTNYNQYSGYLNATPDRFLHYWLVESQSDPANDPLILWLNGGPGCSSLLGMLTELGPFYVDQDGTGELFENPYAWNKYANVFFLESPACVGFSYDANGDCKSGDTDAANQNYLALQDFFNNKFPEYATRDFYITGESYAGIYIPTLATRIIDGLSTFPINFQGFAIGNGYIDINANDNSLVFFAYYHGVIGDALWDNLALSCCTGGIANRANCEFSPTAGISPECLTYVDEVLLRVNANGLNAYNLYSQCGETKVNFTMADSRYNVEIPSIFPRLTQRPQPYGTLDGSFDPACSDNTPEINYLNAEATKTALHISPLAPEWKPCSNLVNIRFDREYNYTVDLINAAAASTRALIFNGDVDMVCNFLGNLWDIEDLGLPVLEETREWNNALNNQVVGYVKRFPNLDFLTVMGAGHMVPGYKPAAALQMIMAFINKTPY